MIVDLIVTFVLGLLEGMFSLLPPMEFGDPGAVAGPVSNYLGTVNRIVPVMDLIAMLAIGVAFSLALSAWHILVWVYEHIPFKAT